MGSAAIHRRAHVSHHGGKAVENRLADQEMADVEFDDLGQRRDLFRGDEIEAVSGMNFEAGVPCECGAADDAREFGCRGVGLARRQSVAPGAGVNLDHRRADSNGGFDLRRLGGNEQRHPNARSGELRHRRAQRVALACGIEAAFGRALGPPLRHDASGVRPHVARDLHHFGGRGHFQVERLCDD